MSAYAHHAHALGHYDKEVSDWFSKGLKEVSCGEHTAEEWLSLILVYRQGKSQMYGASTGQTLALSGQALQPVNTDIKKGPFIVVSGHDLEDMHQLLEQTKDKGINVYTAKCFPPTAIRGSRNIPTHFSLPHGRASKGI